MLTRVCTDPKWCFLFTAISQAHLIAFLYSSYLVLWLTSFVSTGQIADEKSVEMVFSKMTLFSIPSTILTILVTGFLADYIKPVLIIAPAFFGRAVTTYMFKLEEEPQETRAFALVSLLIVFSILQVISLESLFMKNLPRDVRGAMTITLTFFMGISALAFNLVGGPVHDSMGPAAPFVLVSIFDAFFCVFAIILGLTGHLTYSDPGAEKAPQGEEEIDDEGTSPVQMNSEQQ